MARYPQLRTVEVSIVSDIPANGGLPSIQIEHSGSLLPVIVRHILDRIDWQPMWDAILPYDSVHTQVKVDPHS